MSRPVTVWTPERTETLRKLFPTETPIRDIVERTGLPEKSIRNKAKILGLNRPGGEKFRRLSDATRGEIIARYEQGGTVKGVAAALGISPATVQRIVKKSGKARPKGGASLAKADSVHVTLICDSPELKRAILADARRRNLTMNETVNRILADHYNLPTEPPAACPNCGSDRYHHDGRTAKGRQRYECVRCGRKWS